MRRLLLIFVLCLPSWAVISRTGFCAAHTTSCTLSAVNSGDLVLMFAYRSGSTTAPSLPASNTSITTKATATGGTTGSWRAYCRKASSSGDTGSGTATNATDIVAVAYSGTGINATGDCNSTGVDGTNFSFNSAKTSTTADYPAIIAYTGGNNLHWLAGFVGDSAGGSCSPTGMSDFTANAVSTIRGSDTNAVATTWADQTCTVTSGTWMTGVFEIIPAATTGAATPAIIQAVYLGDNKIDNGLQMTCPGSMAVNLPQVTQAGNAIIMGGTVGAASSTTFYGSDDMGNAYYPLQDFHDATNGQDEWVTFATNVAAGTRKVQVNCLSGAGGHQSMFVMEVKNIASSGAFDKFGGAASNSNTVAAGSLTPVASGDFVIQHGWNDFSIANTCAWTVGSQSNITWQLEQNSNQDCMAVQVGQYNSTSALNPTFTKTGTTGFESFALFLKTGTSGADHPAGMWINRVQHGDIRPQGGTGFTEGFPTHGDTFVALWSSSFTDLSSVSDSVNGSYTCRPFSTDGASTGTRICYKTGATAGNAMTFSATRSVSNADGTIMFYDISSGNIFDSTAGSAQTNGNNASNLATNLGSLTPSTSSGIAFCADSRQFNTANAFTASGGISDSFIWTGMSHSGPQSGDENNGFGHAVYSSTTTLNFGFTSAFTEAQGLWSGACALFTAATASSGHCASCDLSWLNLPVEMWGGQ